MAGLGRRSNRRQRGSVEQLPSVGLRVSVYTGYDAVTGRRHYLREVVPAGPDADAATQRALRRLATQVDEQRNPRTTAKVDELLNRYLDALDVGRPTHRVYTDYLRKQVRPFIGT